MDGGHGFAPEWPFADRRPPAVRIGDRCGYLVAWRNPGSEQPWEAFVCWAELRRPAGAGDGGPLYAWREAWVPAEAIDRVPGQDYRAVPVYGLRGAFWIRTRPA
jgi:hypothetical protein